jgi:hypothetical protein
MTQALVDRVTRKLGEQMAVFVSTEQGVPVPDGTRPLPTKPSDLHSVVSEAAIYVGDSQTMAFEAALLGTPTIHISSWSRRLACIQYLANQGLIQSFPPESEDAVLSALDGLLRDAPGEKQRQQEHVSVYSRPEYDVTQWYLDLIHDVGTRGKRPATAKPDPNGNDI